MPNRAIVLAAGLGTRMRPYNGHIPKPLVEIGGKSLIDYSLDRLADAGVESVVVNVHHLADILERHLAPRQRPHIVISDERGELLGTGGGIAKALPKLGEAPFFLVNSDTVWLDGVRPNFTRMAEAFDPQTMDILLLLAPTTNSIGYAGRGDFAMRPDGCLRRRARERGGPLRLCRRGGALADAVRRCAEGRLLAHRPVRPRRRKGPAIRPAPRRRVDARGHAGSGRRRGSRTGGDLRESARHRLIVVPANAGTHNHKSSKPCFDRCYGFPHSRE